MTSFGTNAYTYNCNGIRTSKTVNSVEHTYTLEGSRIVCEKWAEHELIPMYDANGGVYGIVYDDTAYFFMRNLQGDILSVVDKAGNAVAEYAYDAWGKCTIVSDTSGCDIANVNPFRYRGYYYDAETELYYLNSRYYDAEVGRFISADDINYLDPETIGGVNLYAYCVNNPIRYKQRTGYSVDELRITLNAKLFADSGTRQTGSVCNGYATFEEESTTTVSGTPVLIVITNKSNNNGYYNDDYYDPTAYLVLDNVSYSLRVLGDEADEEVIQATLERILSEI